MTKASSIALTGLIAVAAGCSARVAREKYSPRAYDPLCGAPRRAIVTEALVDTPLSRLATDRLAAGLAELGFEVLAPRRPLPPSGGRAVNDWVFSPHVEKTADGELEINVDLRSMLEQRRVWAIADALEGLEQDDPVQAVEEGIRAALILFERDVLRCREPSR